MIRLYSSGGSDEIEVLDPVMSDAEWQTRRAVAVRLLKAKAQSEAAIALESTPFVLFRATNGFGDKFLVLQWEAPMDKYVEASTLAANARQRAIYKDLAAGIGEVISSYIRFVVVELDTDEGPAMVESPNLAITTDVVERALKDAQALIASTGATSGVDRVHTALHGYLRTAADKFGLLHNSGADVVSLLKIMLKSHPGLASRSDHTDKVARAFGVIVDALNPLRNQQSMAHPNPNLLSEAEAMLVINGVRTLLHYLDAKLR